MSIEEKAAKYDWLVENAGKWEVSKVGGTFTSLVDGKTYCPMVLFAAHGTAYLGCFFDDAVTLAMERTAKESE